MAPTLVGATREHLDPLEIGPDMNHFRKLMALDADDGRKLVDAQIAWDAFLQNMRHAARGDAQRTIHVVGELTSESFQVFTFGAYGSTWVAVGSDGDSQRSVEAGLELAAEWLAEHEPGYFMSLDVSDAVQEIADERGIPVSAVDLDEAFERHTVDMTYTESGYLCSWEWTVDDVKDRAALLALQERLADR